MHNKAKAHPLKIEMHSQGTRNKQVKDSNKNKDAVGDS